MIINELMRDIETNIRFRMKNYFLNYNLLLRERYGEKDAGADWADFLEYGTTNEKIIELQNFGLPRYMATDFLKEYSEYILFDDNILIDFNIEGIMRAMEDDNPQLEEFRAIFGI